MKIRITAKQDGFRRCGLAHSKTPTDYPPETFTPGQLALLKAESLLVVEEIEGEVVTDEEEKQPLDLADQIRALNGQLAERESDLDELTAEKEALKRDLAATQNANTLNVNELKTANSERERLGTELTTALARIAELEEQLRSAAPAADPPAAGKGKEKDKGKDKG